MNRCSFLTASLMDFWYLNNHDGKSKEDAGQDTGTPGDDQPAERLVGTTQGETERNTRYRD